VGGRGAGQVVKLVNNTMSLVNTVAAAEALRLAAVPRYSRPTRTASCPPSGTSMRRCALRLTLNVDMPLTSRAGDVLRGLTGVTGVSPCRPTVDNLHVGEDYTEPG
jgi:hypothetical protein